jgi:hypothetical protein
MFYNIGINMRVCDILIISIINIRKWFDTANSI